MKTSFSKKLLACVLSLCMILTLCVGALTVSAAATGTAEIAQVEVEVGATEAIVPVTLTATEAIGGADLFITVPDVADITKVDIATSGYDITFAADGNDVTATAGAPVEATVDELSNVAQFVMVANGEFTGATTTVVINLTFTGNFADGTYPVTLAEGTLVGTTSAEAVDAELVDGAIVAHAHDYKAVVTPPTCTEEGYTTYTCACGESYVDNKVAALGHTPADAVVENNVAADCDTAGSYDSVVYCSVCNAEISRDTITVEATGHTPGDAVVENNVDPDCVNAGSYDSVVYCTVCNAEISRTTVTVDALGHTAGDPVDNGDGTHTIACTVCSEVIETVEHTYTDGSCVCGATEPVDGPVLDENLQFRDILVQVTSTVNIRYRVYKSTKNGINGYASLGYDHVEIVISGTEYSFETSNLYNEVEIPETSINMTASNNTGDTFLYEGISMCSLGLNINAYIKAYDADGNFVAYSPVTTTSPEQALKTNLANTTTDTGKATIIELLNMAAAAQVQFAANKAGTDLATAVAEGKLVNKDLPASIVTELPEFNTADGVANWADGVDSAFVSAHKISATTILGVSPNIRVYVGGRDSLDTSKLSVEFSYYDPAPTVKDTVVKTVAGADASISGKRLAFDIPGFEFHNSNQIVTASVYYDGSVIATVNYSVETYLAAQLADDSTASQTAKDLAAAIAKFGLAFRMNMGVA